MKVNRVTKRGEVVAKTRSISLTDETDNMLMKLVEGAAFKVTVSAVIEQAIHELWMKSAVKFNPMDIYPDLYQKEKVQENGER